MRTITRLRLADEIDETIAAMESTAGVVEKAKHLDHFAARDQELTVTAALYDRWNAQIASAMKAVHSLGGIFVPYKPSAQQIVDVFSKHLSGEAITKGLVAELEMPVATAFNKGRAATSAMFTKQTGKELTLKDFKGVGFSQIFGLTEDHAIQALLDQLTVAAGGLWEEQLSDSIKAEIDTFFAGSETREELISKIEGMVNTRLAETGESSLARSYFDNLSTHQIVRARNVGSYYRAKTLGAVHYTLINPHDHRTSPVCLRVADGVTQYTMHGAESTIGGIIGARSVSDLKAVAPFYKTGDAVTNPVPPLHWPKCRTWMNFIFEGV